MFKIFLGKAMKVLDDFKSVEIFKNLFNIIKDDLLPLKSKKLATRFEGILLQRNVARDFISQLGGTPHEHPQGVPENWNVVILPSFALKYVNPEDREEYIEVIPGDPKSFNPSLKTARICYHHPQLVKNGKKDFPMKNKVPTILFNLTKDGKLLENVKRYSSDLRERIEYAKDKLSDYFFKLEDVQEIRKRMDFPPLEPEAIEFLGNACGCHLSMLSKSGGGIISHHPRHSQFSLRASKPNFTDPTFLKIQTSRGYHTQTGEIGERDSEGVHLKIHEILSMIIDFYDPPCTMIVPFSKFDYKKHKVNLILRNTG